MKYEFDSNKFPSNTEKLEEADIAIFGVPFDETVDYLKGTKEGPKAIREAANYIEPFDIGTQKNILEVLKIIDFGNIDVGKNNAEKVIEKVKEKTSEIFSKKVFPIMLGGEHTISLGAVKAFPFEMKVVVFDAHYDLKEVWQDSQFMHNTWLRRTCELIGDKNVCVIGARTGDEFEFDYAKKILVNPTIVQLQEFVKGSSVYISLDMDVFDPSIAPGVGTPEPGGLRYDEVLNAVKIIFENSRVRGVDVVEVRPIKDNPITEVLAAKMIFKTLALFSIKYK